MIWNTIPKSLRKNYLHLFEIKGIFMAKLMIGTIEEKDEIEQLKAKYLLDFDASKFNKELLKIMNWDWAPFVIDDPSSLEITCAEDKS